MDPILYSLKKISIKMLDYACRTVQFQTNFIALTVHFEQKYFTFLLKCHFTRFAVKFDTILLQVTQKKKNLLLSIVW